jgi:hypothetical protein
VTPEESTESGHLPSPGEIVSYLDMCKSWGVSFQKGMHFALKGNISVLLMSRRRDAPYRDRIEEGGRVLVYEGHDCPKIKGGPDPKMTDQLRANPGGTLTQNGLFEKAALESKVSGKPPRIVAVYEKIHRGIWSFNGLFHLIDCTVETDGKRNVFKFWLRLQDFKPDFVVHAKVELDHSRLIPSAVKLEVWRRDKGRCVLCGSADNLHFDHELPFSKGGTSLTAKNIRLLCARHNLLKGDKIQ